MHLYANYLRASLLCILTVSGIAIAALGSAITSSPFGNSMNCIAYDPTNFAPLYETKVIMSHSDRSATMTLEFKGATLQLDVEYEKEFIDENGVAIMAFGGNATDGKNTYPARLFLSDDGKTCSGRVMGKNYGGPDFAFVINSMPIQKMELALYNAADQIKQAKSIAKIQKEQYEIENARLVNVRDESILYDDAGRFGSWEGDYWKVTVIAAKTFCEVENDTMFDCQEANSAKPIKAFGWMTNAFDHNWCMDTVEYIFYTDPWTKWLDPCPKDTPLVVQWSYSISLGIPGFGVGFGAGTTMYSVHTHADTSNQSKDYHFYFDYVSVPQQYLEYRNTEMYPEGTGVAISHEPYTTLKGETVECTITSYNHPLWNTCGDMGWIPTTFGPASGTFYIRVH
jgi:hypothetical protein